MTAKPPTKSGIIDSGQYSCFTETAMGSDSVPVIILGREQLNFSCADFRPRVINKSDADELINAQYYCQLPFGNSGYNRYFDFAIQCLVFLNRVPYGQWETLTRQGATRMGCQIIFILGLTETAQRSIDQPAGGRSEDLSSVLFNAH